MSRVASISQRSPTATEAFATHPTSPPVQARPLHPPAPALPNTDVMTADEVAAMLRVNRKTVYEAVERGDLPCARLGRCVLFSRAALLRWLDGQGPTDGPTT
jgi:excisionase family DNA binding protein